MFVTFFSRDFALTERGSVKFVPGFFLQEYLLINVLKKVAKNAQILAPLNPVYDDLVLNGGAREREIIKISPQTQRGAGENCPA